MNAVPITRATDSFVEVPGVGPCAIPGEFQHFMGLFGAVVVCAAQTTRPGEVVSLLQAGQAVVLTGPYAYVDGIYRICQKQGWRLLTIEERQALAGKVERAAVIRWRLHHLLLVREHSDFPGVPDAPVRLGVEGWMEAPPPGRFLMPLRRYQRILTDMRRAAEGVTIDGLAQPITILPHVYVPADASVPRMFLEFTDRLRGRAVLDLGTGTGVLALLAARLGADRVVATDINPEAVANARLNVAREGMESLIEVRPAGDLFQPVGDERFDVILFNAPWAAGEPRNLYELAIYDPGYQVITRFLAEVGAHLTPGGTVLLQYSNISQKMGARGLDHLYERVKAAGLEQVSRRSTVRLSRPSSIRETVLILELVQGVTP